MWTDSPYDAEHDALLTPGELRYVRFGKGGGGSPPAQTVQTTSTQKADPWEGQQPFLTYGMEQAQTQYQGPQPQFYPTQTYPSLSPQTLAALGLTEQRATEGSPITQAGSQQYLNTLYGNYLFGNPAYGLISPYTTGQFALPGQGMVQQAGMTSPYGLGYLEPAAAGAYTGTNPAYGYLSPFAEGQFATPGQELIWGSALAGPSASQYFEPTAAGAYLDQGNPQFQAVVESISNAIRPQVQSQFAMAGRAGSGAEQEAMARQLADAIAPYAFGSYESERGRQLQAAGALQSGGETALARMMGGGQALAGVSESERAARLGAAQSIANIYGNDVARQLEAAGMFGAAGEAGLSRMLGAGGTLANIGATQAGIGLQAGGQIGQLYDVERARQLQAAMGAPQYAVSDYYDIGQLGQVGQAYETQDAQRLAEAQARWNFEQNVEAQKLAQYMGLIAGNYGGTAITTGMEAGPNPYYTPTDWLGGILGLGNLGLAAYTAFSSREIKRDNAPIDRADLLKAVRAMPVERWRYAEFMLDGEVHIGPYSEDFQEATGLGDGRTINLIDAFGVALATIQALADEVDGLKAELKELRDA